MIDEPYVPLWCKSNFSFLEGASHPEELVEEAHRLGLPAIGLTDRDGVYGVVRAHVKARELGVRAMLGATITIEREPEPDQIVLFAIDRAGWANLVRLVTVGRRRSTRASRSSRGTRSARTPRGSSRCGRRSIPPPPRA